MDGACSRAISRKRKRHRKHKFQSGKINVGIDNLGDACIVNILSRMSMKEAARTSILSRRWRYLWTSAFGTTLEFKQKDMGWKKFKRLVNDALLDHQQDRINGLIIRCLNHTRRSPTIESWISFAIQKEVRRFELEMYEYKFPFTSLSEVAFPFLQSLRFSCVDIKDNVLRYFFKSCPNLEELRIKSSDVTTKVEFGDPLPNLKTLEITRCDMVSTLELCAPNLVSFSHDHMPSNFALEQFPSLSELTLVEEGPISFIYEPHKHSSYLHRLVKLRLQLPISLFDDIDTTRGIILPQLCSLKRLELQIFSVVGRSILFFASLIKASPLLREFRFEILYVSSPLSVVIEESPYPAIRAVDAVKIIHENLKVVEMVGYIGCSSDDEFLCHLFKIAPTLETVVIDTHNDYYYYSIEVDLFRKARQEEEEEPEEEEEEEGDDPCLWNDWPEIGARTIIESKERASHFITSHNHLTQHINFLVK